MAGGALALAVPTKGLAMEDEASLDVEAKGERLPFQPMDVFALRYASDAQISPDGRRIAYVRTDMDISTDRRITTIHTVGRDGKGDVALAGARGGVAPRWSPDGRQLLFRKEGQLYRVSPGADPARLTDFPGGIGEAIWSPDGSYIAFTARLPQQETPFFKLPPKPEGAEWAPAPKVATGNFRAYGKGEIDRSVTALFIMKANGEQVSRLGGEDLNLSGLVWTVSGDAVLASGLANVGDERFEPNRTIYRLPLDGGSPEPLPTASLSASAPTISRQGQVAFLGTPQPGLAAHQQLWVMERDGTLRSLTGGLDRDIRAALWSADGNGLYILYPDQGRMKIAHVDLSARIREIVAGAGPSDVGRPQPKAASFSVSSGGDIAFVQADAFVPGDVAIAAKGGKAVPLTQLNAHLMENRSFGGVEEIDFRSGADGWPVQAWLLKPPSFRAGKKYPLILFNHGGPWGTFAGPYFSAEAQIYAAAGYLVLAVNYRGSGSFSQAFSKSTEQAFPGRDFDDLMSGVDAIIAKGYADPDNLFVTGGSAGGVLTAWTVGHSKRFRAAVAQKPMVDLASFVLTVDDPQIYRDFAAHFPWEDPAHYAARSPITYVGQVGTPTMLIVGTDDVRTPPSQAESFYNALRLRGVPTALVRLPGAGHEYSDRPSQLVAGALATLGWFDKYRDPRSAGSD